MDINRFIETCDKHQDTACVLAFLAIVALVVIFNGAYNIIDRLRQPREIHHYHNDDPK